MFSFVRVAMIMVSLHSNRTLGNKTLGKKATAWEDVVPFSEEGIPGRGMAVATSGDPGLFRGHLSWCPELSACRFPGKRLALRGKGQSRSRPTREPHDVVSKVQTTTRGIQPA